MKKSKTPPRKSRKTRSKATPAPAPDPGRRDLLRQMRNGAIATVGLGGAAWWGIGAVRATAAEQDLGRIGQGTPAIVQVHDPQCQLCTQLQRQTRKALRCFEDEDLVYLVANIRGPEGQRFAAQHRVPHVTLVFFDGTGAPGRILNGVREAEELKPHFASLAGIDPAQMG